MSNIWVTSDTHFGHENIISYCDRPFSSVEEMDEKLIENWNSVVKPSDKVYHLGDVFFGGNPRLTLGRLNGKKRLVVGNHDRIKHIVPLKVFEKIVMWRAMGDLGLLFTHVPVHESVINERVSRSGKRRVYKNVHGHIHQNKAPSDSHICVCVEQTNYTPVHIDELRVA